MPGKHFIVVLIFLLGGISEKMQAQQFHGGIALGLVGSQVAGDTYSGYNKAGISGGGFVNLNLSELPCKWN